MKVQRIHCIAHRLTRYDQNRIMALADQLGMSRFDVDQLTWGMHGLNMINILSRDVKTVVQVLEDLLKEKKDLDELRRRAECSLKDRNERLETLRQESKRLQVRAFRDNQRLRVNKVKKAAKYRRLGKEFKI